MRPRAGATHFQNPVPLKEASHLGSRPQMPRRRSLNASPLAGSDETVRIFPILGPAGRVVADVLADSVQFPFVADDVFVAIALPDANSGCMTDAADAP